MDAELVSLVSDIVVGLCAIAVAIVAVFGLRTWRKELTGRAKFDVARNVMRLGFKFKDDFQAARNPFTWLGEYDSRQQQENESKAESRVLNEWYARNRRLQPLIEDLQKLQEVGWEAEIVLGENSSERVSEAIAVFRHSYAELSSAIYSYFETRRDEAVTGDMYHDQDWLKELKKEIYSAKDDDFFKRIDEATNQLGSALKAYVK